MLLFGAACLQLALHVLGVPLSNSLSKSIDSDRKSIDSVIHPEPISQPPRVVKAQKKKKPSAQLTAPVAKIALWRGETKRRVTTTSFHQNQFARTAMSMNMFPA